MTQNLKQRKAELKRLKRIAAAADAMLRLAESRRRLEGNIDLDVIARQTLTAWFAKPGVMMAATAYCVGLNSLARTLCKSARINIDEPLHLGDLARPLRTVWPAQ